ncbi:hypothetical protein AcW1_007440 [Taiwanofungus camphoratus]|nr:hypothetical protein AcW1_007440 [Antrodia cinnamomea]
MRIRNVHLPFDSNNSKATNGLYDIVCVDGRVQSIALSPNERGLQEVASPEKGHHIADLDAEGKGILLPALCHGHIHLDKCFLLEKCDELITGDFAEALRVTAKAKCAFPSDEEDLYNRGKRLVISSVECGVTAMRAHVEVDEIVGMSCLDVGLKLREEFKEVCEVQIAAFAQDPLFASAYDDPSRNFRLLHDASKRAGVQAVGSAPYVESSTEHAKRNIMMIFDLAYEAGLHVDFHLDYNLDPASEPLIWHVLEEVRERMHVGRWNCGQHVCVGHATRLTLFSTQEWTRFSKVVRDNKLPITLVGLPPSDMYMMGKNLARAPRSTLDIPRLSREFGLKVGMAINNIGNAFTPQGPVDPLALCPLGVAVFQAGIQRDCRSLIVGAVHSTRVPINLTRRRKRSL